MQSAITLRFARIEENYSHQPGYATSKKYLVEFIKGYFGENRLLFNIRYVDIETFRNKLKKTLAKHDRDRSDASVNRCTACCGICLASAD